MWGHLQFKREDDGQWHLHGSNVWGNAEAMPPDHCPFAESLRDDNDDRVYICTKAAGDRLHLRLEARARAVLSGQTSGRPVITIQGSRVTFDGEPFLVVRSGGIMLPDWVDVPSEDD
jgi:hypothetical protein